MASTDRVRADVGHVKGARPYGIGGNVPADAVSTTYSVHGKGIRYVSDAPFVQPYSERPECQGTRTDGHACKAKAEPAKSFCKAHDSEA